MKNKKELAASRNEYLKAKKEKKKAKWAEIEKEVKFILRKPRHICNFPFLGRERKREVAELQ